MAGKTRSIIVTVSDEALEEIQKIAKALTAKGMRVSRVMPATGVIAGSSPASKLGALKKTSGVSSVEEELVAEHPPSSSKLQ